MHLRKVLISATLAAGIGVGTLAPITSSAYPQDPYARRQQTKNEWRNIAIAGGGLALLGALSNDSRLVFAGAAGGLYALWRYEEDRKSQNKLSRLRASYFSKPYFYRNGKKYVRKTVVRNGKKYYQFVRV